MRDCFQTSGAAGRNKTLIYFRLNHCCENISLTFSIRLYIPVSLITSLLLKALERIDIARNKESVALDVKTDARRNGNSMLKQVKHHLDDDRLGVL